MSNNSELTPSQKRAMEGKQHSQPPIGYKLQRDGNKSTVIVDEDLSGMIKDAFDMYITTDYSIEKTRRVIEEKYNILVSKSYFARVLANPFYYGEMLVSGQLYVHNYESLITKEIYDKAQQKRLGQTRAINPDKIKNFAFRGLIECDICKTRMRCQVAKNIKYYFCDTTKDDISFHKRIYIQEKRITQWFLIDLRQLAICAKQLFEHFKVPVMLDPDDMDINRHIIYFAAHAHALFIAGNHETRNKITKFAFDNIRINQRIIISSFYDVFVDIIYSRNNSQYIINKLEQREIKLNFNLKDIKEIISDVFLPRINTTNNSSSLQDQILALCNKEISFDTLIEKLSHDNNEVRDVLMDLLLDGQIEENAAGLWKKI